MTEHGYAPSRASRFALLVWIACFVMGSVFLAAAWHKINDPLAFAKNIYNYQVLPDDLVNLVAIFLPWLEVVTGVSVIAVPRFRLSAAWIILILMLLFTGLIIATLFRGIDVSCGCFTSDPEASRIGLLKVAENLALIGVSVFSVWGLHRTARTGGS